MSAGREEWLKREAGLDDALMQVGELEEAAHPKAAALRKLGDAIRVRANSRKYQESASALDQFRPKRAQIYADYQRQTAPAPPAAGDAAGQLPAVPTPGPGPAGAPDAASSCHTTITNDAQSTLTLGDQGHERGDFMTFPVASLAPAASTTCISVESPNAKDPADEGCKGFLLWQVGSPDVLWRVEWDNPEGSKNLASATFNPPNAGFTSLNQIGQGEENVPTAFTLSGAGGGVIPPVPPVGGGNVPIRVKDQATGEAVVGASVTIGQQTVTTDAVGVSQATCPVGKQTYLATAKDFADASGNVDVIDGDNPELIIDLAQGGECAHAVLAVTVVDHGTSQIVPGATVSVGGKTEQTSESGLVVLTLEPGEYSYDVSAENYEPTAGNVTVQEGDDNELVVRLEKGESEATLIFAVSDAETNAPIEGAVVTAAEMSNQTDASGSCEFGVMAGSVSYCEWHSKSAAPGGRVMAA